MGRQPWAVFGLMTTARPSRPGVSATEALISLIALTLLYGVLAVVEVGLILTLHRGPVPIRRPPTRRPATDDDADRPLAFAY